MGRADSPLRDRVIFVEGAPRSGTTWLVTLLATHPQIAGVEAESHLFDFGVDRLFDNLEFRDARLHGLHSYLDRDELLELVRDLCDGVFMAMRSHVSGAAEPEYVVEKTPAGARADGLDLERKRDCYPDAWYVHIVRDRDAVTRSLMRAPFLSDRSRAACASLWDRSVRDVRRCFGDLPRYREVRYEELRDDPVAGCRELFTWLGVDAGDEVLEGVRVLSRERFAELGSLVDLPVRAAVSSAVRRAVARGRAALETERRRLLSNRSGSTDGHALAVTFARALREREISTWSSLTHPSLEFVYRGAERDEVLEGDEGREALVRLGEAVFGRRYVGEWWTSAGGGPGEWWTSAPATPFWTIFFSALGADATRVDLALGMTVEGEAIRRVVAISAGPLPGRPIVGPATDRSAGRCSGGRPQVARSWDVRRVRRRGRASPQMEERRPSTSRRLGTFAGVLGEAPDSFEGFVAAVRGAVEREALAHEDDRWWILEPTLLLQRRGGRVESVELTAVDPDDRTTRALARTELTLLPHALGVRRCAVALHVDLMVDGEPFPAIVLACVGVLAASYLRAPVERTDAGTPRLGSWAPAPELADDVTAAVRRVLPRG